MYHQAALRTDRMCKATTGLTTREFKDFVVDFTYYYNELVVRRKKNRERKVGGGRNSKIDSIEEKLFYILWYMKTYPTFDVASFWVGFHRSNACEWVHTLLPILEQTMKRKFVLPQRKISDPEEFLRLFPETKEVFIDGVERLRQRPKKKKSATKTYSGKKKQHTRKSVVVTDKKKRVLVITKQKSVKLHDKRLADKDNLFKQLPKDVTAMANTGFQGSDKDYPNIFIPKKKPKGWELTYDEKETNKIISSYRVIVEHAIGGIKRYRCIAVRLRNRKPFIDDTLLLLSAGLWNYHLAS